MSMKSVATAFVVLTFAAGCASAPPKQVRSEFEDIPVPKGLSYQADKSTIIESPTVKAARLVYRGRLEVDSLAAAMRTTLEANGWRHVSSTAVSDHGVTQVYEKAGSSLEVRPSFSGASRSGRGPAPGRCARRRPSRGWGPAGPRRAYGLLTMAVSSRRRLA
jgi:hypothetical protein